MEEKIVQNKIHAAIFCSPHNPTGRVWERWEVEKAMEIYKKHDVYVISDEIWSDLTLPGYQHIPTSLDREDAKSYYRALRAIQDLQSGWSDWILSYYIQFLSKRPGRDGG